MTPQEYYEKLCKDLAIKTFKLNSSIPYAWHITAELDGSVKYSELEEKDVWK